MSKQTLKEKAEMEVLWALTRWQESLTAEELCKTLFDGPMLSAALAHTAEKEEAEPVAWIAENAIRDLSDPSVCALSAGLRRSAVYSVPIFAAPADDDDVYEIGKRDGYSEAVQEVDRLTGGDGEYRYCTDHDPDRHTPDAPAMIQRIADRFEVLNLLNEAHKDGRDQPDDDKPPAPRDELVAEVERLRAALSDIRRAITEDTTALNDTLWMPDDVFKGGSVVDFIDHLALEGRTDA